MTMDGIVASHPEATVKSFHFRQTEKIYRGRSVYFERPMITNVSYQYELLHISNPSDFYVKIKDNFMTEFETRLGSLLKQYAESLASLQDKNECTIDRNLYYEAMPVVVKINASYAELGLPTGVGPVARGEVVRFDETKADVVLIDFGVVLSVVHEDILAITSTLLRIPRLATVCRLAQVVPDKGEWSKDVKYDEYFVGTSQILFAADYYPQSRSYEVHLEVDKVSLSVKLFHAGIAQPAPLPCFESVADVKSPFPIVDYTAWVGLKTPVFGVKVFEDAADDGKFKCIMQMQPEQVNSIQDMIGEYVESAPEDVRNAPFEKLPGMPCVARYAGGEYYRAHILKKETSNPDSYLIDYVDYKEQVIVPAEDILKSPESVLQFPEGSVICQLTDFYMMRCQVVGEEPADSKIKAEAEEGWLEKLKAEIESKDLYGVIDACDSNVFGEELLVSLFRPKDFKGPDESLAEIFQIKDRVVMAKEILQEFEWTSETDESVFLSPRSPDPNKLYPGAMISCIGSWDSMWIQLADEIDMATRISGELTVYYEKYGCEEDVRNEQLKRLTVGTYVAAKQVDDEDDLLWYRARIMDEKADSVLLLYIDYGNSDWVQKKEVFPLHKYFAKDYLMAFEVALK